jgi:hypothetical protein
MYLIVLGLIQNLAFDPELLSEMFSLAMPLNMVISGWLKPPSWNDHAAADAVERFDLARGATQAIFLREVTEWDVRWQRVLFQMLVPVHLLTAFNIDPITLTDPQGRPVAFTRPGVDRGSFRLELYSSGDAVDPMGEIELSDTLFNQIEIVWVALQDPNAPRFDIDVMPNGASTMRGTAGRNLAAEEAALAFGLAPGQIRRGMKAARWLMDRVESLMLCLNQREFIVQPLFYHTAVLFEQFGFGYMQGQARMDVINKGFAPGGALRAKLDSVSRFRRPEQADTIRGRSWAIHDDILDQSWDKVRMVKRLGIHAGVNTCPGIQW